MRRILILSVLSAGALAIALALIVNLRAAGASGLPPPDPRTPIQLPGGETVPLADLLARLTSPTRAPVQPLPEPSANTGGLAGTIPAQSDGAPRAPLYPGMSWGPLFELAEQARQAGRPEEALALYLSIPEDDPDWARAHRRIAWDICTRAQDEPRRGVPFAQAALVREPFNANSWQDLARVYGATLGLDTDGWD